MVNHGKELSEPAIAVHQKADVSNRILIPKHLSQRIAWLNGSNSISAWLWLVSAGRYRLLSDDEVRSDIALEPLRSLLLEGKSAIEAQSTYRDSAANASTVIRLSPINVTPPGPGWRFQFPRVFEPFIPAGGEDKEYSVVYALSGHLEIWHTISLREALLSSLHETTIS